MSGPADGVPNPVWSARLARPDHVALEGAGRSTTALELAEAVAARAGRLAGAGVGPGTVVGLCGPPRPGWVVTFHAIGWLGAVAAPISADLTRAELLEHEEAAGLSHLLFGPGVGLDRREALAPNAAAAWTIDELPPGPRPAERLWPLEEARAAVFVRAPAGGLEATTLSTRQLAFSAFGVAARLGHLPGDRWLSWVPLHEVEGLTTVTRCAFLGATLVVEPRLDAARLAGAVGSGRVSGVVLTPHQLRDLLDAWGAGPFPATLRTLLLVAPASAALARRWKRAGAPVVQSWSVPGAAGAVAVSSPGCAAATCGAPLPFVRVVRAGERLALSGVQAGGRLATDVAGGIDGEGRVRLSSPPPPRAPHPVPPAEPAGARAVERLLAVAERHGGPRLMERAAAARAALGLDLAALEDEVRVQMARLERSDGVRAPRAARDLLSMQGKRLRPICLLLAARLGGRSPDPAVHAAALAVELLHTATLLHDDVIDEAQERRGAATARVRHGNAISVLAGDCLFAAALESVQRLRDPSLLASFLEVIAAMVEAEALQLELRGRADVRREQALRVVRGKTAALFRWALWAGGRLGALAPADCQALARAGEALGLAFQLADDVLDLAGDAESLGKDPLVDIRQGRPSWPVVLAIESDPGVGRELAALAAAAGPDEDATSRLLERIRATGAIEQTRAAAASHADLALQQLRSLPQGWPRATLESLAASCGDAG